MTGISRRSLAPSEAHEVQLESPIPLPVGHGGAPPKITDGYLLDRWVGQQGLSPTTRRAYSAEGHRLIAWLGHIASSGGAAVPLLMLPFVTEAHVQQYAKWLASDVCQATQINEAGLAAGGLRGQPRRKALHPRSLVQAIALINALWEHASEDPHTAAYLPQGNPVARVIHGLRAEAKSAKDRFGRKRTDVHADDVREKYLNPQAWRWVIEAVEALARNPQWRGDRAKQAKLVVWLGYFQALRIHEVRLLDDIDLVPPEDAGGRWRIDVTGKGGSKIRMTVYDEVLQALRDFWPDALARKRPGHSARPLVRPIGSQRGDDHEHRVSISTLQRIFEKVMNDAANLAGQAGQLEAEARLIRATSHWCRHARVSHVLNAGTPLRVAQKLARHASSNTTRIYDHSDPVDVDDPVEEATRRTMALIQSER